MPKKGAQALHLRGHAGGHLDLLLDLEEDHGRRELVDEGREAVARVVAGGQVELGGGELDLVVLGSVAVDDGGADAAEEADGAERG